MEGDQNEIKGKQFELSLPPLRIAMTCDLVQPTNRIPLSNGYLWNLTAHAAHTKAHNQLFLFYFAPNPSWAQWKIFDPMPCFYSFYFLQFMRFAGIVCKPNVSNTLIQFHISQITTTRCAHAQA